MPRVSIHSGESTIGAELKTVCTEAETIVNPYKKVIKNALKYHWSMASIVLKSHGELVGITLDPVLRALECWPLKFY